MLDDRKNLILFTRFPQPGNTKTRLIPVLGPVGACDLQRRMTEQVMRQAAAFCRQHGVRLEIFFEGGDQAAMVEWLGAYPCTAQGAGTIGERMEQAFAQAFARGMRQVVIIGTDCPGLQQDTLRQAFLALRDNDLVLGPAMDGGYYLIGLSQARPFLFAGIAWGTAAVLQQTMAQAHSLNVRHLVALHDIDRPEDLVHFHHHSHPE